MGKPKLKNVKGIENHCHIPHKFREKWSQTKQKLWKRKVRPSNLKIHTKVKKQQLHVV